MDPLVLLRYAKTPNWRSRLRQALAWLRVPGCLNNQGYEGSFGIKVHLIPENVWYQRINGIREFWYQRNSGSRVVYFIHERMALP